MKGAIVMPNYYNPYNFFPTTYPGIASVPQTMNYPAPQMQQSYTQTQPRFMEWVEGEVGAKAFQKPAELPANQPIPLWDSTDTVIYLKSWSPMGIPNPMQKLHYEMPESQPPMNLQSGQTAPTAPTAEYASKDDLESLKNEIRGLREAMTARKNQNGSSTQTMSRGGGNNA